MKKYKALRKYLIDNEISRPELAECLNTTQNAISKKMTGKNNFTTRDIIFAVKVLGVPESDVYELFIKELENEITKGV